MTSPTSPFSPPERRSRRVFARVMPAMLAVSVLAAGLAGCAEEEPPPPVAKKAPPPPPPPPPPPIKTVADLMADLGIDDRVVMEESQAPASTEDRKALLTFFDAFVRGDDRSVGSMLSFTDQQSLQELVSSGAWGETTGDEIAQVTVQAGRANGLNCVLALFEVGSTYQPQLWYYTSMGSGYQFEAAPTPPNVVDRLSGNWIESWHELLAEEALLAVTPDVEIEPIPEDEDVDTRGSGGSGVVGSGGGGGGGPPEASDRSRAAPPGRLIALATQREPLQLPAAPGGHCFVSAGVSFAPSSKGHGIEQRVAIVTGASRGIGRAIAERLAADGRLVVLVGRSAPALEEVRTAIVEAGHAAEVQPCDVGDASAAAELVESVASTHGRLDVLVNNAGITRDGLILRMSDEDSTTSLPSIFGPRS